MDNNLIMSIACLVGAIIAKAGQMASEDLISRVSESDRWPLDEWYISTLGLGYAHKLHLSRDEVLKRTRSSKSIAGIIMWVFLAASAVFGVMWKL